MFPAILFFCHVANRATQAVRHVVPISRFASYVDFPVAIALSVYMAIIVMLGTRIERCLIVAASLLFYYVVYSMLFDGMQLREQIDIDRIKQLFFPADIAVSLMSLAIFVSAWRAVDWHRHYPRKPPERDK